MIMLAKMDENETCSRGHRSRPTYQYYARFESVMIRFMTISSNKHNLDHRITGVNDF